MMALVCIFLFKCFFVLIGNSGVLMDWKIALKVGGPSVLAVWGFYHLIVEYINGSTIFKSDFWLNILLLSYIFVFFIVMAWLWLRTPNAMKRGEGQVQDNEIKNNEVSGSLSVSAASVVNNKITGNKVGGDLSLGE